MAMVKSAMKTGSGQLLWPRGVQYIEDVPADLAGAISHACKLLGWYEKIAIEKLPPMWMMPYDDEVNAWFEAAASTEPVERDDRDQVPMMDNEID